MYSAVIQRNVPVHSSEHSLQSVPSWTSPPHPVSPPTVSLRAPAELSPWRPTPWGQGPSCLIGMRLEASKSEMCVTGSLHVVTRFPAPGWGGGMFFPRGRRAESGDFSRGTACCRLQVSEALRETGPHPERPRHFRHPCAPLEQTHTLVRTVLPQACLNTALHPGLVRCDCRGAGCAWGCGEPLETHLRACIHCVDHREGSRDTAAPGSQGTPAIESI